MEKKFIMTAFGKDRPGIVADVTEVIYENKCNVEDSSMTLLADEFTIILLLTSYDEAAEENLTRDCRRLEKEKDISAYLRPVEVSEYEPQTVNLHYINVEGMDQAGIVYKISRYLADKGINIINLDSANTPSPESGAMMYSMEIEAEIPASLSLDDIETELNKIGDELNVDVTID